MSLRASTRIVLAGLLAACAKAPPPGYSGPLPSEEARAVVRTLAGRALPAGSVAFFGGELVVGAFLVGPDGPVLELQDPRADGPSGEPYPDDRRGRYRVPLRRDGDVADLMTRLGLEAPAWMEREASADYRARVAD